MGLLSGLVSVYKLNETTGNRVNSLMSLDLVPSDAGATYSTGKLGNCFYKSTDGANAYLRATTTSFFQKFTQGSHTVSEWIKIPVAANFPVFYSNWNLSANATINSQIALNGAKLIWFTGDGTTLHSATSTSSFSIDTWYHLVFTYDTQTKTKIAYVNKDIWITPVVATHVNRLIAGVYLDLGMGTGATDKKVYIDETYIWNRVLSQAEITLLYNAGNGNFYDNTKPGQFDIETACQSSILIGSGSATGNVIQVNV